VLVLAKRRWREESQLTQFEELVHEAQLWWQGWQLEDDPSS
jgi:hypothetical protein